MKQRLSLENSSKNPFISKVISYTQPNLIDLDDPIDSEATSVDPKKLQSEIGFLKKWVVEEEAKHSHLEKDKERLTLDAIVERDSLLRRMATLKEQNKKLTEKNSLLHSDVFGDLDSLKSKVIEQEKLLSKTQEPVITQGQAYKLV